MRSKLRRLPCVTLMCAAILMAICGQGQVLAAPDDRGALWTECADILFQSVGVSQGLPNPVVMAVAQDRDGFIWAGTGNGLARWDGYRFHIYKVDAQKPGSLPDNFITLLHAGRDGELWIGTATRGVVRYDRAADAFTPVTIAGAPPGQAEMRAMADDGASGLWVGGASGLYHTQAGPQPGTIQLRPVNTTALMPPNARITALLQDKAGNLWVGTTVGLYRRNAGATRFDAVDLASAALAGKHSPGGNPDKTHDKTIVQALLEDSAGRVWAGTTSMGAFMIAANGAVRQVTEATGTPNAAQVVDVQSLAEPAPGEIWLGSTSSGLLAVNTTRWTVRHIVRNADRASGLPDDTIWDMVRDNSGAVWVATNRGIARHDAFQPGIITVFGGPGSRNGIPDTDILSVLPVHDGRIWLGLMHGGVAVLDPAAPPSQAKTAPQANASAAATSVQQALATTNAIVSGLAAVGNKVFIATWHGLLKASDDAQSATLLALPDMPVNHPIMSIAHEGDDVWIAAHEAIYRMRAGSQSNAAAPDSGPPQPEKILDTSKLSDARVRVILPAGDGRIWVGTWNGLNLVDPATSHLEKLVIDMPGGHHQLSGMVTSLMLDKRGRLWASTTAGIAIFSAPANGTPQVEHILGVDDGLPNPAVDKLLLARDGHVWAATDDGLAEIDPDTFAIRALHRADGVVIPAYWVDSGAVTEAGDLLFGGTGGVTVVRPSKLRATPAHHDLVVTEAQIGGHPVAPGLINAASALSSAPPVLVVTPGANSLSVEFSSLDFVDPTRDLYAYRLQGVDSDWIAADPAHRIAAYTNLPPGDFTLLLRCMQAGGSQAGRAKSDAPTIMRIPVRVLPAWYQTSGFEVACSVGLLVVLLLAVQLQTLLLRGRERMLERLVAVRTKELSESRDALGYSAQTLRELGEIGQELTASRDVDKILLVLHSHISRLLDIRFFAVYIARRPPHQLTLRFGIYDATRLPSDTPVAAEHQPHVIRAMRERCDVVADLSGNALGPPDELRENLALICAPLIVLDRVIGVMMIQLPLSSRYGEREKLIVRTIAAYGAIALDNAETLMALAQARSRLELLAYTDGLTNLPNRRSYLDEFQNFMRESRRLNQSFALMLIDLDNFKQINDTHGHDVGDAMLVETARRLRSVVRNRDMVMRLGGDEFAILMSEVDGPAAVALACHRVSEPFEVPLVVNGVDVHGTISIGVALCPADGETHEAIYKAADLALYAAKRAGRNTWRRFEPTLV